MLTIHCSSLPRVLKCPASMVTPEMVIDGDSPAARLGRAVHEAMCCVVRAAPFSPDQIAARFGVDAQDVRILAAMGRSMWGNYAESVTVLSTEYKMEAKTSADTTLAGTCDLLGVVDDGNALFIADWKSGRGDYDHRDQLIGYALMATLDYAKGAPNDRQPERVICATFFLRDQEVEVVEVGADEVGNLVDRLRKAHSNPAVYSPGPDTCHFCPRQFDCPARAALVRSAVADMTIEPADVALLPAAQLARLYPRAKMLQAALDAYDQALRRAVKTAGKLPLGDGRALTLRPENRQTLISPVALPVLIKKYGIEAVSAVATIGKGAAVDLARASVEKGKGKAQEALMEELSAAGAVESKTVEKLVTVKEE